MDVFLTTHIFAIHVIRFWAIRRLVQASRLKELADIFGLGIYRVLSFDQNSHSRLCDKTSAYVLVGSQIPVFDLPFSQQVMAFVYKQQPGTTILIHLDPC